MKTLKFMIENRGVRALDLQMCVYKLSLRLKWIDLNQYFKLKS